MERCEDPSVRRDDGEPLAELVETAHATEVAQRVRTGFIWVNSFGIRDLAAPFGGIKRSGIGREGGNWSFEFFCDIKDVVVPNKPFRASFSHR